MGIASVLIGAAVSTLSSGGFTGVLAGIFGPSLFAAFLVRAALGLVLNALAPKPKSQGAIRGYQVTQKGAALDQQVIYGKARIGGVIVHDESTGFQNKFFHRVIVFSGHEIESFDEIYIDDAKITNLDTNGNVAEVELPDGTTSTRYNGFITINKHLGDPDQTADEDLVAESEAGWSNQHRLRGCSYLYCKFKFGANVFPSGIPEVTAVIKGKKVYDPRSATTVWSDNPALCLNDYLQSDYGLNESTDFIDEDSVITSANVCDQTDTLNGEKRYTCNGAFVTSLAPYDVLNEMLSSMGGLLWYSQGKWRMKPAYYVAPTVTLTDDDLRSEISVQTRHSRRDNFNTVRGTFRGEESDWQVTDYPEVTNQDFIDADNGQESVVDLDLPFTDNSEEARRVARIFLERNRQQLTISASFGLKAFQLQVGDIVQVTLSRFGWTDKEFEVTSWTFGQTEDMDLQVQLVLREISESVFDEISDGAVYERDNTTLYDPFDVPNVGISAVSETKVIREKLTNVITTTITSNRPDEVDYVEVGYRESGASEYISLGTGELGDFTAVDLEDGEYDFRARAVNTFGIKGDYAFLNGVEATGLTDAPQDVSGFSYETNGDSIDLLWDAVLDLDLSYYRIRFTPETSGTSWSNAITYVDKVPRPATTVSVPARSGTFLIKAYDKTGVPSDNATSIVVPSADLISYVNTDSQTEDPTFPSTSTSNVSVVSSELRIDDYTASSNEGQYDFSDYIDTGAVRRARVYVDVTVERFNSGSGLFDGASGLFDDAPGLFDDLGGTSDYADTDVEVQVSTTDDDPAGTPTWSAYRKIRASTLSGRAFRFRVYLRSTTVDVTPAITGLTAYVKYD